MLLSFSLSLFFFYSGIPFLVNVNITRFYAISRSLPLKTKNSRKKRFQFERVFILWSFRKIYLNGCPYNPIANHKSTLWTISDSLQIRYCPKYVWCGNQSEYIYVIKCSTLDNVHWPWWFKLMHDYI